MLLYDRSRMAESMRIFMTVITNILLIVLAIIASPFVLMALIYLLMLLMILVTFIFTVIIELLAIPYATIKMTINKPQLSDYFMKKLKEQYQLTYWKVTDELIEIYGKTEEGWKKHGNYSDSAGIVLKKGYFMTTDAGDIYFVIKGYEDFFTNAKDVTCLEE